LSIARSEFRQIIREELNDVLREQYYNALAEAILSDDPAKAIQELNENWRDKFKKAAAGAALGATMLGATPALAGQSSSQPSDMDRQMQILQKSRADNLAQTAARQQARQELAPNLVQTIDLGPLGEREVNFTDFERQLLRAKTLAAAMGSSPRIDADWAWDILEQTLGAESYNTLIQRASEDGQGSDAMKAVRGAVNAITGAMITMTRAPMGS
jgi:hypothetical protein